MATTDVSEREARQVAEAAREQDWKLPSFGKELFLGNFRLDLIHPQPKLDAEAVEKGEALPRRRCASSSSSEVDPLQIERDSKIPDEVIEGFKRHRRDGDEGRRRSTAGSGSRRSITTARWRWSASGTARWARCCRAHQSIGVAEPLRMFGSEEQKREWLPRVARTDISAFLLTEPDVGSDPARVATSAEPVEGGYVLNGTKLWATNGAIADVVVVMARVPKSEGHKGGISAFVLDYNDRGRRRSSTATRSWACSGIENSVTTLEDVFVPAENLIGKEGWGLKIALSTLNTGRLALPAICVGQAKWATKIAREWSTERVQWGRPVGKHDAVAQKNAFIAASAFGLEAMLDVASRLADEKRNDIRIEAAIAKLYGSELALDGARRARPGPRRARLRDRRVAEGARREADPGRAGAARHAHQPHLRGLDRDHAPADRARGGRHSTCRSRATSWTPRRRCGDKAKSARSRRARSTPSGLPKLVVGEGNKPQARYDEFGDLATYLRYVERSSRRLARSTFYAMGRWQAKLEQRQSFLGRIVDIGAELFAISRRGRLRRHDRAGDAGARRGRPRAGRRCSARRPSAAPTGCSTSCGPTTTTRATRPR